MVFRRLARARKRICIFVALSILFMIALRHPERVEEIKMRQIPELTVNGRTLGMLLNNFQYKITPRDVCRRNVTHAAKNRNRTIIICVHSSRENYYARQLIRETYGSVKLYQKWSIMVIFLVGLAPNNDDFKIGQHLEREIQSYGDILMGDFEDTYSTLVYKHLLGYKFATESCNDVAKYYVKSDDNSIVNVFHVVETLITWKGNDDNDFYCRVNKDFKEFGRPDYCGYSIYLTSMETVRRIYSEVNLGQVHFSRYDDVFLTGNVRAAIRTINLVQAKVMHFDYNNYNDETQNESTYLKYFGKPKEHSMWLGSIVQSRSTKLTCGVWSTMQTIHRTQIKPSRVCGHVK